MKINVSILPKIYIFVTCKMLQDQKYSKILELLTLFQYEEIVLLKETGENKSGAIAKLLIFMVF